MPRSTIARRMALIGATTAAATAVVSAVVPLLLLIWRLSAADARTADGLAEAVESGIARERVEEPTLERAARDVLEESSPGETRIEIWGPSGLIASRGPGAQIGAGRGAADTRPRREMSRLVVRRPTASGLVVAVAVPISFSPALRREMGYALLLGVIPLSILAAAVSMRLARRALAPLEKLASDVSERRPDRAWEPVAPSSADAEVVHLADALNETGRRLTEALAAEREFAAYAAHALRTPLTRLAAAARNGTAPSGGALETLRRLVEGLLLLVRTGTRLDEAGATVNIADLVRHVAAAHAESGHDFTIAAPDEVLVRGDEELLAAALDHLVDNAVRYSPPGASVHLAAEQAEGRVLVSVRDEGPGVPVGEIERIFRPFVRGAIEGNPEGSGLGLALVARISAGHGGSVRAVPAGTGTSFEIILPGWRPR